jgi:hypothetical protein
MDHVLNTCSAMELSPSPFIYFWEKCLLNTWLNNYDFSVILSSKRSCSMKNKQKSLQPFHNLIIQQVFHTPLCFKYAIEWLSAEFLLLKYIPKSADIKKEHFLTVILYLNLWLLWLCSSKDIWFLVVCCCDFCCVKVLCAEVLEILNTIDFFIVSVNENAEGKKHSTFCITNKLIFIF